MTTCVRDRGGVIVMNLDGPEYTGPTDGNSIVITKELIKYSVTELAKIVTGCIYDHVEICESTNNIIVSFRMHRHYKIKFEVVGNFDNVAFYNLELELANVFSAMYLDYLVKKTGLSSKAHLKTKSIIESEIAANKQWCNKRIVNDLEYDTSYYDSIVIENRRELILNGNC